MTSYQSLPCLVTSISSTANCRRFPYCELVRVQRHTLLSQSPGQSCISLQMHCRQRQSQKSSIHTKRVVLFICHTRTTLSFIVEAHQELLKEKGFPPSPHTCLAEIQYWLCPQTDFCRNFLALSFLTNIPAQSGLRISFHLRPWQTNWQRQATQELMPYQKLVILLSGVTSLTCILLTDEHTALISLTKWLRKSRKSILKRWFRQAHTTLSAYHPMAI